MKETEKDYEYLETSREAKAMGLKRITRPKRIDAIVERNRSKKNRVTIYFDSDIIDRFKEEGEREGVGYQTLMNAALRRGIDGQSKDALPNGRFSAGTRTLS